MLSWRLMRKGRYVCNVHGNFYTVELSDIWYLRLHELLINSIYRPCNSQFLRFLILQIGGSAHAVSYVVSILVIQVYFYFQVVENCCYYDYEKSMWLVGAWI